MPVRGAGATSLVGQHNRTNECAQCDALCDPVFRDETKGPLHMARALVGYVGTNNERVLALEVGRLRRRVAELEDQLAEARASHPELDIELHRLAESAEPALT